MSVAYLANRFPEALEAYVGDEISELRNAGHRVVACSIRRPLVSAPSSKHTPEKVRYVLPILPLPSLLASWLCLWKLRVIAGLVWPVLSGPRSFSRRCRALAHTWMGAYLAVLLKKEQVRHLHVHHGYFAAWVGMVAARLLGSGFSMTLHGSDLLLRGDYLDAKLKACDFCFTVSDFNRRYILNHYPQIDPLKVFVQHLGVDLGFWSSLPQRPSTVFSILSVGRLHSTKNHAFLLRACAALKAQGILFRCAIAGEGEDRGKLEWLIVTLNLGPEVTLLGHIARECLPILYANADVVVLTSRSEGLPVTLMEAMAMERIVLAPRITGIPELVTDGETGFLYTPNSIGDFLSKLKAVHAAGPSLDAMRRGARRKVEFDFNAQRNLAAFARSFLENALALKIADRFPGRKEANADPVLQQVQL